MPNFFSLVVVIVFARFCGLLLRRLGQPSVMGEVLGGILLGPSVLGFFYPDSAPMIFHPQAMIFLRHIAEIGIALYLFVMGLEINLLRLKKSARAALVISQVSIVIPFLLGIVLATCLFDGYAPEGAGFAEFSLFMGISLSITAFPVLARILAESPLNQTRLGELAMACAALDDITAWCLLALVTCLQTSSLGAAWITIGLTIAYLIFILCAVRPLIERFLPRFEGHTERLPQALLAFAVLGALISATITELIGIHAFFGAFIFGAAVPHGSLLARDTTEKLRDLVAILFLPAFFALTGLKTQLGLLNSTADGLVCVLIILLAIVGKFGGTYLAARLTHENHRDSAVLGLLMNTRGLVELIALNIGLQIGVISPTLFTMLVIMALVTTLMTGPLLKRVGV